MLAIGQWFGAFYKAVVWCLLLGSGFVLAVGQWFGACYKAVVWCLL